MSSKTMEDIGNGVVIVLIFALIGNGIYTVVTLFEGEPDPPDPVPIVSVAEIEKDYERCGVGVFMMKARVPERPESDGDRCLVKLPHIVDLRKRDELTIPEQYQMRQNLVDCFRTRQEIESACKMLRGGE